MTSRKACEYGQTGSRGLGRSISTRQLSGKGAGFDQGSAWLSIVSPSLAVDDASEREGRTSGGKVLTGCIA